MSWSSPQAGVAAGWRPFARFDDVTTGRSIAFREPPSRVLEATCVKDVAPILGAVEQATAAGQWAAGFVAYEAAAGLDPSLSTRTPLPGEAFADLPLAWFCLFGSPDEVEPLRPRHGPRPYSLGPWLPDWDPAGYSRRHQTVRDRIAAGDTYQCNLTGRLRSHADGDLFELYRDLALAQRGRWSGFVDAGRFVVASASPELFFEWDEGGLTTRPMKGTIARGRWPAEDAARAHALSTSVKDRAENIMIVDLLRSDLGKLADWGGVGVPALLELERFETVWQLTSTVTARVPPAVTLVDVFRALFPCGSVTGAPKRRTMTLINELENSCRGVYCGAVGVVAPPGGAFRARFNVAIRTVVVDRTTNEAVYGTGGAVTWGSIARSEHAELMAKAAILERPPEDFALVETIGFWPEEGLRNGDRHLARLASSAAYFGFALDVVAAQASLGEALVGIRVPTRVRFVLSREGVGLVELSAMPGDAGPVGLAIDEQPVRSSDVWLYHKTTRRSAYEVRASRHPDCDDVVLINERGQLTETTVANLALRIDGRWWTPSLDSGCLPGIERGRLLETGRVTERSLNLEDLYTADAVALVSSLRGWRPAHLRSRDRNP